MRRFFFLLLVALVLFCTTTVYLYQHRGNAVCLKGTLRRTLQPFAEAWYAETREVVGFYQDLYEKERRTTSNYCKKTSVGIKQKRAPGYHNAYSRMTNTLMRVKQSSATNNLPKNTSVR